jgi:hypothetical protein
LPPSAAQDHDARWRSCNRTLRASTARGEITIAALVDRGQLARAHRL